MRNFMVVIISIIMLSVFIGFNYVVWDREQVVSSNENKDTTIRTLSSQISEINVKNQNLNDRVGELNSELVTRSRELNLSKKELESLNTELEKNKSMIIEFKKQIDINIFKEIIELWVQSIKAGSYEDAYRMQTAGCMVFEEAIMLDDFRNIFKNSKISIQLSEIYLDDTLIKEASYRIKVQFTYKINEELAEDEESITEDLKYDEIQGLKNNGKFIFRLFPSTDVIRNCTFEYDSMKGIWMISEIN